MKRFILAIATLIATLTTPALANGPWNRVFQDYKFPSQAIMEHKQWVAPAASNSTLLVANIAVSSTANTTIAASSLSAQPDFARNIILTPVGTTENVAAGTAVVSGLNIFGKAISENFTITASQNSTTVGNKAFASVSSVLFPQTTSSGVKLSIGTGNKLGLHRCANNVGDYVFSEFGGTYDSTRGTMAVASTVIESNTFVPNTALDGSNNVDIFFVQDFRCYPGQ